MAQLLYHSSVIRIGLLCLIWPYLAQATINVPVTDPIYSTIDKLIASDLVVDFIYGQRPWNRHQIARMIQEAEEKRKLTAPPPPFIDEILEQAKSDYRSDLEAVGKNQDRQARPIDRIEVSLSSINAQSRSLSFNSMGDVDASINPLVAYLDGKTYPNGTSLHLSTFHSANLASGLSFFAQPEGRLALKQGGASEAGATFRRLYASYPLGENLEIELGRDAVNWGQTENGGLVLSNNARPLDLLKISSPYTWRLPWFLKYMGPMRATFFLANFGPDWSFPYAFLTGYHLSFRTHPNLEWGFSQATSVGGRGSPSAKWYDLLAEGLIFLQRKGTNLSDHHLSFNGRLRLSALGNAEWYGETFWDDAGFESIKADLTYRLGFLTGLYFPTLAEGGKWDLRLEFTKLPITMYRNATFRSGYTLESRLLGNAWGSDSLSGRIVVGHHFSAKDSLISSCEYASNGGDVYDKTMDESEAFKVTHLPTESRWVFSSQFTKEIGQDLLLSLSAGVERVGNFNFQENENRWHYRTGLALSYSGFGE